eukprot:TRINITY_DN11260_c0_g1_i1.p1 TRINITY_DN11260_c0_g1~~TRINITY_DN11260_c0_g1_i1.p1  ORF type:complete len:511 (-),score=167.92 TRINITY_DN11260_c0_g1_i1:8-1540(-)
MTERKVVTLAEITGLVGDGSALNLANRSITEIPELTKFPTLKKIDLSNNALDSLSGIKHNLQVTWLSLKGNKLTKLTAISRMRNLVVLNAAMNEVKEFDPSPHPRLSALILNNNQLTKIPTLDNNLELNTLVLSHNKIEEMTPVLAKLGKMKKLSLSHNQIREISYVSDQFYLHELKLNDNKIRNLPETLAKNVRLEILDLGNNQIRDFDDIKVLSQLKGLKNLNLKGNPITQKSSYPDQLYVLCPFIRILDGKRREIKSKNFVASDTRGSVPQVSNTDSNKRKREVTDVNEEPAAKRQKTEQHDNEEENEERMETEHAPEERAVESTGNRPPFQKRNKDHVPDQRPNNTTNQRVQRNDGAPRPPREGQDKYKQRPAQQSRDRNNSKVNADQPVKKNTDNNRHAQVNKHEARDDKKQGPKQNKFAKKGKQDQQEEQNEKPVQNRKSKEQVTPVKEVSVKVTDENALADDPRPDHVTGPSSGIVNIKLAPQKKQFSVKELLSNTEQQVAGW